MLPRASLLALALFIAAPLAADDEIAIQRHLADLQLGDTLEQIQLIYRPLSEWSSHKEPRGKVTRHRAQRHQIKNPPREIDTIWMGLRRGRLVDIQLIYTAAHTRARSVDDLASELSIIYGEGRRQGNRFWWTDGRTVLRVFYAEVPKEEGVGLEWRTSLQVMDENLFTRTDSLL